MKRVNVLGEFWTVTTEPLADGQFGECRPAERRIVITTGLSDADHRATLLHELLHAILFRSGLSHAIDSDSLEEAIVRALEHGLTCASGKIRTAPAAATAPR